MENYYLYLAFYIGFAFVINLPFGYKRATSEKFTLPWWLYIHLPIPLIIYLRFELGFGWGVVPFGLLAAVLGQVVGARMNPAHPSKLAKHEKTEEQTAE